jgi:hypothetical protein
MSTIKRTWEARSIDWDGKFNKPVVKRWMKRRAGKLRRGDYRNWIALGVEELAKVPEDQEDYDFCRALTDRCGDGSGYCCMNDRRFMSVGNFDKSFKKRFLMASSTYEKYLELRKILFPRTSFHKKWY